MERFKHLRPPEVSKLDAENKDPHPPRAHVIEIIVDNEMIGGAALLYSSKPFPLYEIGALSINKDELRGRGYGSRALTFIENFLKEKGKAGVLQDHLARLNPGSDVVGMYERHGWEFVPGTKDLRAFNLPKGATLEQLAQYPVHQKATRERLKKKDK